MNDFEYIKDKFDNDGLKAPESLSKEALLKKIDSEEEMYEVEQIFAQQEKRSQRKTVNYLLALAACLMLSLIAIPAIRSSHAPLIPDDMIVEEEVAGINVFKSAKEVKKELKKVQPDQRVFLNGTQKDVLTETIVDDAEMAATGDAAKSAGDSAGIQSNRQEGSYSDTYKQVEGVDEADIIKTDGKYIYLVDGYNEVEIHKAKDGKTELVSTISDFNEDKSIENIYLYDDKLITVGSTYDDNREKTIVTSYDLTDKEKPEKIGEFEQSGYLLSSRLTGGIVYLVTNEYANEKRDLPFITTEKGFKAMPATDIGCFPHPSMASFVTVSSINFKDGKKVSSKTKAILGASDQIYCNEENLYLTSTDGNATRIIRVALNNGKLAFKAAGKVRGTVYGQFAMDEKDYYFRIATTSNRNGRDENNLYVLDSNLEEVGSLRGFAKNEHIESVRFIGSKAYVITYKQIDPLFILDLTDPKKPEIDGEVKITGFSTLLVPIAPDRLIGIGYETADNGYGGEARDGLKLALFDIGNPDKPQVLDSKSFKDMSSEAQVDHHALIENKDEGYLAIPYYLNNYYMPDVIEDAEAAEYDDVEIEEARGGVLVFTADGKIKIKDNHEMTEGIRRCVYIGDYIYAVKDSDEIEGFKP